MIWNDHHTLEGLHAFIGASKYHWLNWNDETLIQRFFSQYSTEIGTVIHAMAADYIKNRLKLTKYDRNAIIREMRHANIPDGAYDADSILANLMPFVNDAIGFHMDSEVILFYSFECFGTADAIAYDPKQKKLRIHDLKTGSVQAHFEQLEVYAALFFLEYKLKPSDISTELRIYQSTEVAIFEPESREIEKIMDRIIYCVNAVQNLKGRSSK